MAKKTKGRSFFARIDPLTSAMLVFPLFVLYEIGIVAVPGAQNGADLITAALFRVMHGDVRTYVLFNASLLLVFVGVCLYLRRTHSSDLRLFWPVLFESALYAVSMGSLICFVMVDLLHVDPSLSIAPHAAAAGSSGTLASIIKSLGAGVHEELLFRVVILSGTAYVLSSGLGLRRWLSLTIAFIVSSVLFSAAHHIIGGEPFRVGAFTYRILCGLIFASLYEFRGLAVAVYTHAIYDIFVFLFKG
jgi:hypothetical protein